MTRILMVIGDIVLWLMSAGFGFAGVLFSAGAYSSWRRHTPDLRKRKAEKILAGICVLIGVLSFAAFVALASLAYSVYRAV